jgi:uncharacterized protein (TIGR00255 family)
MTLNSMTGFARVHGQSGSSSWAWELKSVNAKGFDVRLRLPPGFDGLEAEVRRLLGTRIARGTIQIALELTRQNAVPDIRINTPLIVQLAKQLNEASRASGLQMVSMDTLIGLRGVVEMVDDAENEDMRVALGKEIVETFETALNGLCLSRKNEGLALFGVLLDRVNQMSAQVNAAEYLPSRKAESVRKRLETQIADLLDVSVGLDPQRLHQEAMILALKADIREELDRLVAHCFQARELLQQGGAVGRRLDFLSQELSREANTLCAKSNDVALTAIGINLKTLVEQFREQVQNVE